MNTLREKTMHGVFLIAACASILAVILICVFLFSSAWPAFREIGIIEFLFGRVWRPNAGEFGILPMILGSAYVTAGAVVFGVPIGILCAMFMAFFCPKRLYGLIKPMLDLMAGIPSIVYGFFGLVVIVPPMQRFGGSGKSILTASLLLGIMILPTIVSVSESALRAVPVSYYEGSLALGATHERSIYCAAMPAAKSGILAGVILGIGRAVGETMAVIMVAGNMAVMPMGLLKGVRTMTANIVLEMAYAPDGLHRQALIATAVVLFVLILIINLSFSALKQKGAR